MRIKLVTDFFFVVSALWNFPIVVIIVIISSIIIIITIIIIIL